jgi:2-C-methyl-D-erythritol 2,4-cyclodiphosphate synthase
MRIGFGWDLHRLGDGKTLMLGGVEIPSDKGEIAHSDGDVLLHAIIDALLGAAALGDIGTHFPPDQQRWKDADSGMLLTEVMHMVCVHGYKIENIDTTIVLQAPKLSGHIQRIRQRLSELLVLDIDAVSVKAKSAEHLGPVGNSEAIEAYAQVLLTRTEDSQLDAWV